MISQRIYKHILKKDSSLSRGNSSYLDHASATPMFRAVIKEINKAFKEVFANPSALHKSGLWANRVLEDARNRIGRLIGAHPDEIVFTSGGTESDNLAILGVVRRARKDGFGNHIILGSTEHSAITQVGKKLENEGLSVSYLNSDSSGFISKEELERTITPQTILVSLMYVNNEVGTILPIPEYASVIRRFKKTQEKNSRYPLFHTDAIQAFSYCKIFVEKLGVDLMTLSTSKIGGPKGVGVLYVKRGTPILPEIVGGGQELGLRSGTQAVPLIIGSALSFEIAYRQREKETDRLLKLKSYAISELSKIVPNIFITSSSIQTSPHILHIGIPNVSSETIQLYLDAKGVAVSSKSSCDSDSDETSHVLDAISFPKKYGAVRISFGHTTRKKDIDILVKALKKILPLIRN